MENISNEQLLFDRQESFNDIVSCLVAINQGIGEYQERLDGNLQIINAIKEECDRRGFDPAQLEQILNPQPKNIGIDPEHEKDILDQQEHLRKGMT